MRCDNISSARTPIICHMARPVGVAVSFASVSEWNFTPPHAWLATPDQIDHAQKLIDTGEARQYVADLLNVGPDALPATELNNLMIS
jgi:hypothetical protein